MDKTRNSSNEALVLQLTEQQKAQLQKSTGKRIESLRIEDLQIADTKHVKPLELFNAKIGAIGVVVDE